MSQQPPSGPPPPPPGAGRGDGRPAWETESAAEQPPQGWDPPAGGGAGRPTGQNGPAIGALVCGILGLVLFLIPVLGLLLAVIGIALGIVGVRRARDPATPGRGLSIAGIVTGALGALLGLWLLVGLVGIFTDDDFRDMMERIQEGEDPEEVIEDLEQEQTED